MKYAVLAFGMLVLSACGNAEEKMDRVANDIKQNMETTEEHWDKWSTPTPKKGKQPVPVSYCYRSLQDILCYRQPMPGWEARLVGYQGTGAMPPEYAQTQPLARRISTTSMLPANRAQSAKPLVVGEVPKPKSDEEQTMTDDPAALAADPIHESLPDPVSSQQM